MVAWIIRARSSHSVGLNPARGICLYGTVVVINTNNNSLQWTHYIHLPKEYGIDRSESEMTGHYSNSIMPGGLLKTNITNNM